MPIINGLSDLLHPCQVLGDLLTLHDAGLDIRNMKAAWVGDGSNVANSWITAAELLGFELTLACPEGYDPRVNSRSPRVRVDARPHSRRCATQMWSQRMFGLLWGRKIKFWRDSRYSRTIR